jgi:hypothetical protein
VPSDRDDELPEVTGDEPDDESGLGDELADTEAAAATTGYLIDYISGKRVRATPEEVEAVQVFARRLVEDYEYPREHLKQDHNSG